MITLKVHRAKNEFEKIKGLMGAKEPKNFLLKTRFGIHTLGLKFPIDVVILNNDHEVVVIKPNLRPNSMFLWNPKYSLVLELPKGEINKHHIAIGKKIELES